MARSVRRLRACLASRRPEATGASVIRVAPESIAAAIARAAPGAEVVVEPGEYREQIRLKTGVRVVSRVPRGASLRLPGGASETDAAVVAFEVSGARALRVPHRRRCRDAARCRCRRPQLGCRVERHRDHRCAHRAAIEYVGADGGSLVGANLHDNPGVAIMVRAGASPRIAHNTFARNATSERAAGTLLVEATHARPC